MSSNNLKTVTRRGGMSALFAGMALMPASALAAQVFDVRSFGARGDGVSLDTDAINASITAASSAGGGTVLFPRGRYLSFSIRMKSNITLALASGAVIEAASPASHNGKYDLPEAGDEQIYQDFGHSYWRNSLIWGDGVENVAILGPGLIDGAGLTRSGPNARWRNAGGHPLSMGPELQQDREAIERSFARMAGQGNKAIAFKNARNVRLSDFKILRGGHFAILLTGGENISIDGVEIDTNRDGIDIDCVKNCTVTNCRVNSPNDDGIVLKSSFALGRNVACENVIVRRCVVSGYDIGSMLNRTFAKTQENAPDRDRVTGRIKFGTESNGGFRNILIENCRFERSRGLALETVDGGNLEDVVIRDLTMIDVTTAPIFFRIGARLRAPENTPVGKLRRVSIRGVHATGIDHRFPAIVAGLPGNPVEDIQLRDIALSYRGGGTPEDAQRKPPEVEDAYPEPSMFGVLPSWGLWIRHARNVQIVGLDLITAGPEARPPIAMDDAEGVALSRVSVSAPSGAAGK